MRRRIAVMAALALAGTAGSAAAVGCGDANRQTATVLAQPTTGAGPAGPGATVPTTATPAAPATTRRATTPAPATTAPVTTDPTATTGVPPAGALVPNGGTPAGGEQAPGGAGDEQAQRVPAAFTVAAATITPAQVTLPAFLAIEVAVTAKGGAQKVTIAAPGAKPMDVSAGATGRQQLSGLKPGDYAVTTAAGGRATLHVVSGGAAPGP